MHCHAAATYLCLLSLFLTLSLRLHCRVRSVNFVNLLHASLDCRTATLKGVVPWWVTVRILGIYCRRLDISLLVVQSKDTRFQQLQVLA